ncbi:hypothetical protein LX16_2286 [Stackebrandtia albiflava]|uniref:PAS domain-containing protein n=1 Tax=Stackebrandtia albiflava TaxID=406432 RepID=A0A562V107_9ACTN|nr:hypothetical protein [Stackebrandtia albiflava]TWJ11561.1 hypothetical protein LX16_2286 [Stackebrandtia albiflava]
MPHIELSLSAHDGEGAAATCRQWEAPVGGSADACLLLDAHGVIVASSPSCRAMLGLPDDVDRQRRQLVDGLLRLLGFSAGSSVLPQWEVERIPPLQALKTGALARGLLRVSADGAPRTLDAIATPLHGGTEVVGSLSFFRRC